MTHDFEVEGKGVKNLDIIDVEKVSTIKDDISQLRIFASPKINNSKQILMGEMILDAGGKTQPQIHDHSDEAVLLLAGKGFVYVDGEQFSVCARQSWVFPRGCVHYIENAHDSEKMVIIFTVSPLDPEGKAGYKNLALTDKVHHQ